MNAQQAMLSLAQGIQLDVADYDRLHGLLEQQFAAALRHDVARLPQLAEDIGALCVVLDARRTERVTLVNAIVGMEVPEAQRVAAVFARLPERYRTAAETLWQSLQARVLACKALNLRNGNLLMDQYEVMQRVLGGESDTYAPR
ncbi:MAG: flagellar export chaperone FlgN [Rhodocyclaceae bacterium]|uniref:Flagella synthesis protein FlgN n=1 Tax=Sphingomonas sp. A1 TaxID=90322 RepID=A0A0A8K9X2_9SPHN|nr:flagella synthesis protein FlgN [Sphingomonas sp. A1]